MWLQMYDNMNLCYFGILASAKIYSTETTQFQFKQQQKTNVIELEQNTPETTK